MSENQGILHHLLVTLADARVASWPFMTSPFPVLVVVIFYVLVVRMLGPWLMKNREPYDLKVSTNSKSLKFKNINNYLRG